MAKGSLTSLQSWRQLRHAPNLISLSRILVAVLIIWLYETSGRQPTLAVIMLVIYGVFSDYYDGYLARRRGEVTEFGKALDPVADKIGTGMLFVYAVWIGTIPVWYLGLVVVRDLLIMMGSLYVKNISGQMPSAIMSGKVSINAVAAYWMSVFFAPDVIWLVEGFKWFSIACMLYSFGEYMLRYYRIYQEV